MNKGMKKVLALALAAAMMLSACGSSNAGSSNEGSNAGTNAPAVEAGDNGIVDYDMVTYKLATAELQTFNLLSSQTNEDFVQLTNLVDGLCESNPRGQVVPCLAESWETTDGGVTWTFHLRDGIKWVDMNGNVKADCNAWDWATGLEWVLNYYKNESANTSMPLEMLTGVQEYIDYTKSLSEEEAHALTGLEGSKFLEMVGIEIVDDLTIKYTCVTQKPYFDTLAIYACLYPMAQGMVDELGVPGVKAMDNTNMWYNGAYTMTSYTHGNEKIFTANPMYWDTESTRFATATFKMVDSADTAFQLYRNGEIDYVALTESNLNTIYNDPNHEFHNYLCEDLLAKHSYQWHFNFDKHNEDGSKDENWNKAIANENFRKALYHGINLTERYKRSNAITPLKIENNAYTMQGLITLSDGREYTQIVRDTLGLGAYNGETPVRYDAAKGEEYKQKAIEELTAIGVTFPVQMDYYISGASQTALDTATVEKNAIESCLGKDFIEYNILTYVSSSSKEVRDPKLHSIMNNGWGADYGDPMNFLAQEIKGYDNAWYADAYSNINEVPVEDWSADLHAKYDEFTEMVWAADAITDNMDARYEAFAKAEAYMIDHVLVMPYSYGMSWCLTKLNIHSYQNAMYGVCNGKMKNWEYNLDGYTTDGIEAERVAKKG